MREINLVKKKISSRPFHHTGEEIHFWSYTEEGSFEKLYSASLTKEFEKKLDNDISNFWFDIQSSIPEDHKEDNTVQVGYLKVKDNLGILKALREILVDEDSKKLYLVILIKNGGSQETVIERQGI